MVIGVISDTHLFGKPVPRCVLEALEGSDMILHAGDILEMSVIEELSTVAKTIAIRGNMDHGDVSRELPSRAVVEAGGFRIGLTHGSGPPTGITGRVRREFGEVDCIVFGHTHSPLVKEKGGVLFFNPGSPTDKMFARRHTIGFLDVADKIRPRILDLGERGKEG